MFNRYKTYNMMKKIVATFALMTLIVSGVPAKDVITGDMNKLPAVAREMVRKHFSNSSVSYIKIDSELIGSTTYEAVLKNGTEIDFDSKGNWKEVDGKKGTVPMSVIPSAVRTYLKAEFPQAKVKKIEKKRSGYEVELDNGLDLHFDLKGSLKKIDD